MMGEPGREAIGLGLPKLQVFASNQGGPGFLIAGWQSIFTNAKQEEECKHNEVGRRPVLRIDGRPVMSHDVLKDRDGQCELRSWRWVLVLVALVQARER
jgi:hypothetical protein